MEKEIVSVSYYMMEFFAILFIVLGIALLVQKDHYFKIMQDAYKHPFFLYLGGIGAMFMGFVFMVLLSDMKTMWDTIFFFIGIMIFMKGIILLLFPVQCIKAGTKMLSSSDRILPFAGMSIILGIFLGYFVLIG